MKVQVDILDLPWFSVALRPQRRVGLLGTGGSTAPNSPYIVSVDVTQHWRIELRSCVKVEVDTLGSLSLTVHAISVDVDKNTEEQEEEQQQEQEERKRSRRRRRKTTTTTTTTTTRKKGKKKKYPRPSKTGETVSYQQNNSC